VLLCVLWVRSYWTVEYVTAPTTAKFAFVAFSVDSHFSIAVHYNERFAWRYVASRIEENYSPRSLRTDVLGFDGGTTTRGSWVRIPYWFLVGLTAAILVAPWLRWRFSLRTLLIATTLVAVVLGFLVWLSR
jgi:hypothetical protein